MQPAMDNIWQFDPAYSTIEFVVRNLWFNVKGRFQITEGVIVLDPNDVSRSSVRASIKAESIDTGNKRRDAHLRSADFLNVEKFPEIEFQSTKIRRGRDRDSLDLEGNLIVKGKTVPIALAVNEMDHSRAPSGEEFIYYSATTDLDRFELGITYGRGLIGRRLKVVINVQVNNGAVASRI